MDHTIIPGRVALLIAAASMLLLTSSLTAQQQRWQRVGIGHAARSVDVDASGSIYVTVPGDTIVATPQAIIAHTLWRSDDDGVTWTKVREGLSDADITTPFPGVILASVLAPVDWAGAIAELAISTDGGRTWLQASGEMVIGGPAWNRSGTIAVGTVRPAEGGSTIHVSIDSGRTWRRSTPEMLPRSVAVTPSGAIVINGIGSSTSMPTIRSTDGGLAWVSYPTAPMLSAVAALPHGTLIAAGLGVPGSGRQPARMYRSTDDGQTWQPSEDTAKAVRSIHWAGDRSVVASGATLYRTTDDGVTWSEPLAGDTLLDGLTAFLLARDGALVALDPSAKSGSGVLRSTDVGNTWSDIGAGIEIGAGGTFNDHAITAGGAHLVATSSGLWRSEAVSSAGGDEASVAGGVLHVAPHPVSGDATITLDLERTAGVTLTLHDALGRHVRRLHDATLGAGRSALAFDAHGLAAGTYVVRAVVGTAVISRVIVIGG